MNIYADAATVELYLFSRGATANVSTNGMHENVFTS